MQTGELQLGAMALTAEDVLAHFRSLPPRERLKLVELVEQVVHETAEAEAQGGSGSVPARRVTEGPPIYQDLTDQEFEDFMETLQRNRREQPLRTPR